MKEYFEHNSAREWWNNDTGRYEKYYEMTDEKKKEVIKYSVDRAYVFNIPSTEENPSWMSPEVNKVMMDVQRQLESYNFDHSDSQSDYYHVNFWSHYDISKEAVERSLKITRAPEKSLNFVLDKLAAAGIEVVQDKAEFDRILESNNILQKMETSSTEGKNPLFQADEKELKAFAQKVDDWKAGKLASTEVISEFSTSTVLQAINIPANKVSVTQTVLEKMNAPENVFINKSHGHYLDIDTIKNIPNYLANPVMVFKSVSRPDSYIIMTETVDSKNQTVMIALAVNKIEANIVVNNITSAYGREENEWFIEQIKEGNLIYQNKQKSLEWTNERGLLLPPQMSTQGSLNVIQKEDIVNKRTSNFSIDDRKIEFTENQQEFLKSIGFENSLNEDGSLSKSSFFIKNTEGKKNFLNINLNVNNNTAIFVKNEEAVNDFLIYDNSHKYFFEFSMIAEANPNEPLVPAEALGKVLSDYALDRLVSVDDELMEEKFINKPDSIFVEDNLKKQLEEISFKSKVVNLPAKYISEDIYSSEIQPIGKVLQFVIHDTVAKAAGLQIPKQKHYLLEIQTDNNYKYVHNKAYPRLYEAKWDRNSQSYIDIVELDLSNFDSKIIGRIQYIAANNCNYPNPPAQTMTLSDGKTYGFAYEGKIYLNPEIANSEVALHEYTHLWDNYTQRTNPELWQKGKDIFKNTQFWEDVKADPNYADIADNEDLLLSEVHSQLCGKMADSILTKIAERDGELTKDTVIDWDKETWEYIATEIPELKIAKEDLKEFLSMPMKDLMNGVEITKVINLSIDKELQSKMKQLHKPKELQVYTFSPFGYEGALVQVETDLRRGIPAYDIVGISDGIIKETRERIRAAFNNSGLEFPSERVLQSLSPADLKKDSPLDLSMALDILGKTQNYPVDGPVLALGELELSGEIRPVRGAVAAVNSALTCGISNIICDPTTAELLKDIHGIKILAVENLKEAHEKLQEINSFKLTEPHIVNKNHVEFVESDYIKESLENLSMDGHFETVRAIEVAVAGKHNILTTGAPGCGKTMLMQALMPALTPKLTEDEIITPRRIASIAGLDSPNRDIHIPPFRMPHQTASIEGMCGGGPNCRPGEISLAHNGTLFLDEAAEFRSSVLQMLRVPIESKQITLSRAGRTTSYPANFQLAMATNPCPCGCYGSHNKICLDSAKSIDLYWKKFSGPLLDRVEIKTFVEKDENDTRKMSIETMKAQIANAYEIQRKRGVFNSHMTPEQIEQYCKLNSEGQEYLNKESDKLTIREKNNLLKLSLTLANMDGREEIHLNDLKEARELSAPVFEKPRIFKYQPEIIEDPGLTQEHINAAEKERNRIIEPILNGERTGMYKAFKEFEEKGVFDIKGKNVTLAKNGGLTPTGWKQLQTAMEIYRNKKFETFRYIMIDRKTGEIADQLAITSHMPNFCSVSKPNDETLKQVITRAEEKDYLIAVCHNHPSGNTTESSFDRDVTNSLDRSLRNSDGLNRFAGHIILDHNTFNLAVPSEKTPGKCHWKKMDVLNVTEIDHLKEPLSKNPDFKLDDYNIISSSVLISVAQQINDTDNWNDNFVPVVFTNADRGISGVQYYSKNFFENDSNKIRNEFQLTAKEAGAIGAFPVITDNLWNKIPAENRSDFEARMKTHVMNDAFTDVAIDKTTITEKYGIEAGRNYYSLQHEQKDRQVDVDSTWEPSVNSLLFPPEGVGEVDKSNDYKTSPKIKELYLKESKVNIFKDSFIQKEKFVPAIFKNNDKDYIIRVSGNDLINEKYNSINTIYIHMNKNQLQNVLKFHLNNEWNRILDNPASEIKLKIRNPKTLSSNQKELFISKGITDEIKMQKLYADIHKEILFDENNPIVVSKRNFVKQKQIERQNEIQNIKNEFDTDFGY